MALTNAQHVKLHKMKLRDMRANSYFETFSPVLRFQDKETKLVWDVMRVFPVEGYYELNRRWVHESGREYSKTILVSTAVIKGKYHDIHAKDA